MKKILISLYSVFTLLIMVSGASAFDKDAGDFNRYNWYQVTSDIKKYASSQYTASFMVRTQEYGGVTLAMQKQGNNAIIFVANYVDSQRRRADIEGYGKEMDIITNQGTFTLPLKSGSNEFGIMIENNVMYLGVRKRAEALDLSK